MTWLALKALPWKLIGYAALGMALVLMFAALKMERAHSAKLQAQIEKCAEARKADRAAYESAQNKAKADNLAHVRDVEQQQKALNNEAVSNLNARLELLRRELRKASPAAPGSAGSTRPPQAGSGPAAPGEAGLCLAPEELLRGAENEERHDQLITVVERLMKLLNAAPSPSSSE